MYKVHVMKSTVTIRNSETTSAWLFKKFLSLRLVVLNVSMNLSILHVHKLLAVLEAIFIGETCSMRDP